MRIKRLLPALIAAAAASQAATVSVGATADDWFSPAAPGVYASFVTSGNPPDGFLRTFGSTTTVNRSTLEFSLAGVAPAR